MFRISSFQIVLILVWLISHLTNSMQLAACISTLFNLTQRCDSDNYYYGTTLNYGDELGTEFNYWLMRSMMRSFATNRRFVYMVTHRDWAFDCPQQHGWACYLNFPSCHNSIIEVKDMNFTNTRNPLNIWKYPGPKVAEQEAIRNINFYPPFYKQVLSVLRDTYEEVVPKGICDFVDEDNIWPSDFGGILTQYLYRLNDNTLRVVDVINHRYDHLLSSSTKPFIGVMLRMNDTNADEMTNSDWLFVADVNQVSNRILEGIALHVQRLQVSHIHDIFIGKSALFSLFIMPITHLFID